ncbi:hypothetical protein ABH935_008654 [Catenulispora sp. GAS73]|uniref:LmbU family transcriptional regulator n=1 Tax=Catenulispora sp. GAS73 TaxID=3156269 RepID=UPI0035127159
MDQLAVSKPDRVPNQQGARRRQVMVTSLGLQIPDALDITAWEQVGHKISAIANCTAWCLGDWLVYGQYKYGERYRAVAAAVNLDFQTLRNYAWVARRYELESRREHLSFQHHAELAAVPPEAREHWLDLAEEHHWSRNELRRNLRATRTATPPAPTPTALPQLSIAADRIARWRDAARRLGRGLEDWIVLTLDDGAEQALS